ncbi:substrate-binding domain-containing protein [Carboxylicivirga sp. A043]|uniref:substrate-binding domain-containing protein n=1 Tax=Carboxylicivirga litoralis TaxID=2816963 RepID=UPI0021CAFAFC|nr:substrate-binding domain-containing protein [Carboxylicivirga sp. A043]MCU4157822.1 substrate-binding domain-containing protein [Carboxylicivirga sp. A043]
MKIRIVDIAKKADVSVGTVDRYIHKRGKVSKKATEKIQQAVKELGYEPDILARNLALKKEFKIVCLLPDPNETKYWERPDSGVDKAISELSSFKVTIEKVFFTPRLESFNKACQKAIEAQADGIVYVPMFLDASLHFAEQLHQKNIASIQINIHLPEAQPLAFIGQNPFAAGEVAASLCDMARHENDAILITYISKKEQEYAHHHARIDGFTQYFDKSSSAKPEIHHLSLKIDEDESQHELLLTQFLEQQPQVKIIYVPNSRAYRIASILDKNQTNKIIVGFDTLNENIAYMQQGIIDFLIGQQSMSQGYNAVMLMFNALFRKEDPASTNYMPIDILNKFNMDFYEGVLK